MPHSSPKPVSTIHDLRTLRMLFWVCWIVYFMAYIGRLNYSASMVEIGVDTGFSKSQLGLVSTVLFVSYGAGQLFSGLIGDYVSPRLLVFVGTAGSALCNLFVGASGSFWLLVLCWGLNGIFQSLIWSPMVRIFSLYMPSDFLYRSCINIQSSCSLGNCSAYLISSCVIVLSGWRMIFLLTCILLLAAAILWEIVIRRVERLAKEEGRPPEPAENVQAEKPQEQAFRPISGKAYFLSSGMVFMIFAVIAMGILKEGVMTWVPGYLTDVFQTGSSLAIFITAVLPLVNLIGVFVIPLMGKRFHNEVIIAGILFFCGSLSLLGLVLWGRQNLFLSLLFFSIVTSSMIGVNTALISLVPTYFIRFNKTSVTVGLLNSMAYIGSAISGYGIGLLAERAGWDAAQIIWLAVGIAGVLSCGAAAVKWDRFKREA